MKKQKKADLLRERSGRRSSSGAIVWIERMAFLLSFGDWQPELRLAGWQVIFVAARLILLVRAVLGFSYLAQGEDGFRILLVVEVDSL